MKRALISFAFLFTALLAYSQETGLTTDLESEQPAIQETATVKAPIHSGNEISVSYGLMSLYNVAYIIGGAFAVGITGGKADIESMGSYGAVGLEYMRWVHPYIGVGVLGTYETCYFSYKDESKSNSNNSLFCLMPAVKAAWFNRDHFGMYSKAAVGASMSVGDDGSEKIYSFSYAFQVNPVGMDFGGKAFRGFLELGWGMQGFLMGGVRYSF